MELLLKLTFIHFLQELIWENLVKDQIIFLQAIIQEPFSLLHIDILRRKLKLVTKISFLRKRPRTQTASSLPFAQKSMSKCNMQVCESSELRGQKAILLWFHTAFLKPVTSVRETVDRPVYEAMTRICYQQFINIIWRPALLFKRLSGQKK